jgi:hypothetical protein
MNVTSLNFAAGLKVVSSARKLIFRVPQGPVVTFPEGAAVSEYGQNNAEPVIVVLNRTDKSMGEAGTYQGADAENGIVIMNNVPEAVALELLSMFETDGSIDCLNAVVRRADELGCHDIYTTKVGFVDTKLTPAGKMIGAYTGIVKRDDRDVCVVVRDDSGVIQRKLGDKVNHIDTDEILVRDYVMEDGSKIDASSIPNG